jgi:thiol-disulfide isomerase/thioredoxin
MALQARDPARADGPIDASRNFAGSMVGRQLPPIELRGNNGVVITASMLRGKPVLIDFWATWCEPCVAALPELALIHKDVESQGLILLSVNQDKDEGKAAAFLLKRGYKWPDFHEDKDLTDLMGPSPLPRIVLVDAGGTIVYDHIGFDGAELRHQITRLGVTLRDRKENGSQAADQND